MPAYFVEHIVLPCTNEYAQEMDSQWKDLTIGEFYHWLGLWCEMLTIQLPERRSYWTTKKDPDEPWSCDFSVYMSRTRFEDILVYLHLSDFDEQIASEPGNELIAIKEFIDACCEKWRDAITVAKYLVADESIMKGYAAYLYAKKKIKKPRPIGIEMKDLCCGECKIVVGLGL